MNRTETNLTGLHGGVGIDEDSQSRAAYVFRQFRDELVDLDGSKAAPAQLAGCAGASAIIAAQ